ncbi:ABC transporter substrate-binding protein [Sciscionella marina]|uniref:ABC transporter substrate-binding protein n=1 Tax=Sciscionella marina TaxID=508770 RepID=UPI00058F323C|nr:ABC transporter substrate-binding protein [Sciscionella marina]
MRRRIAAASSLAVLLASGLTACAAPRQTESGTTVHGGRVVGGKVVDGVLEYGHEQEPSCLIGGWVQQVYLMRQFLDSLVTVTADGAVKPWLATSWSQSPDGRSWTFHLKPGVRFTDGTKLDAAAVAYNFDSLLTGAGANSTAQAYLQEYYAGSRAIDATTFRLDLRKPYQPLLPVLAQGYFGIQSPAAMRRGASANCVHPVGSGAWIVRQWNRGQNVVFTRNDDYNSAPSTASHQGPAYQRSMVWKFLKDPTLRYGSLETGASDVIYDVPTVDWAAAKRSYAVQRYITPGRAVSLTLNATRAPFSDERLRRAFAYSLDRKAGVDSAFHGAYPYNGDGALSKSTPGYDPRFAGTYSYQPRLAARLLDQAGWTARDGEGYRVRDGSRLTAQVVYPAGSIVTPETVTLLQDLQSQAKEIGWDVQLVPATQSAYFAGEYSTRTSYDAMTGYWTSPTAGVMYITWRQDLANRPNSANIAFYNSRRLEGMIAVGNAAADPAQRQVAYSSAQRYISDHALAIGLYAQTTSLASAPDTKGVWIEQSQGEPVLSDAYFTGGQ